MRTNVAVVDDGSLAMRGAIQILEKEADLSFVSVFKEMRRVDGWQEVPRSTVWIIDPFCERTAISSELSDMAQRFPVLALSFNTDPAHIRHALTQGLRGYVSKNLDSGTLLAAVRAIGSGGVYLGPTIADLAMRAWQAPVGVESVRLTGLTPREQDVLVMIAEGLTHKQISMRLSLSKATVDTYAHRIRQKVGAVNKAGLTRVAVDMGLMSVDV